MPPCQGRRLSLIHICYLAERAELPASMPEYLEDAKAMELTDGSRPMAFVTREEAAVMARAAAKRE